MFSFECDYHEGAHPKILQRLIDINYEQLPGYGEDEYSARAKEKIRKACGTPDADVFFFGGGTQTNVTIIDTILETYEGVVSAETGHVNNHESGGVEFTGHKVLTVPSHDGKVAAADLLDLLHTFYNDEAWEHIVFPGALYISHPTEMGTLYTKAELQELADICHEYDMPLYLDGARLGYGLMAPGTDVTLRDIAEICDVFYIGGTKVGALCGEAVVFPRGDAPKHFFSIMKQRGAVFAKGRVPAIQFDVLFEDDLYLELGKNGIDRAMEIKKVFTDRGFELYTDSPTNQQYFVLANDFADRLREKVFFETTKKYDDDHIVARFCACWATTTEQVERLAALLDETAAELK